MQQAYERGRGSYARRAWGDAVAFLSAADEESPLPAEDLERLAFAAYLIGRDENSKDVFSRAYREMVDRGNALRAARCAFWLGFVLMCEGHLAQAAGWRARARRLVTKHGHDCPEQGYLLMLDGRDRLSAGEYEQGLAMATQAAVIGDRFGDLDLVAHSWNIQARALIRLGKITEAVAVLDEMMVVVTTDELSPLSTGHLYCGAIDATHEIFDLHRAVEWTIAVNDWCTTQPDLVPFRGQCLVHRAEIMQLRGDWAGALAEARAALPQLHGPAGRATSGAAHYLQAELHRLRGEFGLAAEEYRLASEYGFPPHPGLALLRLAEGRVEAAHTAIRRALDEPVAPPWRNRLLAASVEIMLAAGDVPAARAAAEGLAEGAATLDARMLSTMSAQATGAVLLAEGAEREALPSLRRSCTGWQRLEVPYEAARARVLIGQACRQLGDEDGAALEWDAALLAFERLGAEPDAARVRELASGTAPAVGGLSPRELEVLRLVAAGRTNRTIAAELVISEKTVARHVSNILTKLGVFSRAAATAYAYETGVVQRGVPASRM